MDPRFFRHYLDMLNERVVVGPDGKRQPAIPPGLISTDDEPTDDQIADAEEKSRAALGLPSKKADDEAQYQRQLKFYKAGDNRAAGPFFKPRPGDELKERVTVDPATGQSSDPRQNPGQEAYDIQKQKQQQPSKPNHKQLKIRLRKHQTYTWQSRHCCET